MRALRGTRWRAGMSVRLLQCTEAEYHADPCERPSLSSSIARVLLEQSPAHAWVAHPKLGNIAKASTKPQDEGTLIHTLLLGEGPEIEIIDAGDFRTKAAREARDAAVEAGRLPVLTDAYDAALATAEVLRGRLGDRGIELDGDSEVAIEWTEPGHDGPVLCRGRLDHVKGATIYDVKKIQSAAPGARARAAMNYGMDVQHAAYSSALTKLKPELAGRVELIFVFVEIEPPFAVVPCPVSGMFADYGERRWYRAVESWERCLNKSRWPSYTPEPIDVPAWAVVQEETYGD